MNTADQSVLDAINQEFERYLALLASAYAEPVLKAFERRELAFGESLQRNLNQFKEESRRALSEHAKVFERHARDVDRALLRLQTMTGQASEANEKHTQAYQTLAKAELAKLTELHAQMRSYVRESGTEITQLVSSDLERWGQRVDEAASTLNNVQAVSASLDTGVESRLTLFRSEMQKSLEDQRQGAKVLWKRALVFVVVVAWLPWLLLLLHGAL